MLSSMANFGRSYGVEQFRQISSLSMPYKSGMDFGRGFDMLDGSNSGTGVTPGRIRPIPHAGGQIVAYDFTHIRNTQQLVDTMFASFSAQGSSRAGYSARVGYDRSSISMVNSESSLVLARSIIINPYLTCPDAQLEPQAVDMLRRGKVKDFRAMYGDMYVSGMATGGAFFGMISITCEDKREQNEVAAYATGKFNSMGNSARVSASISEFSARTSSSLSIGIHTLQLGGQGLETAFIGSDFSLLFERMQAMPRYILNHAIPAAVELSSFKTIDNFPPGITPHDIRNDEDQTDECIAIRNKYQDLLSQINFLESNPSYFVSPPASQEIAKAKEFVEDKIRKIEKKIREIPFDDNYVPPEFTIPPGFIMPKRKTNGISDGESAYLGTRWEVKELLVGEWKRRGLTRYFDATFRHPTPSPDIHASLRIEMKPDRKVTVSRTQLPGEHNPGEHCTYKGTHDGEGNVTGTYGCDWASGPYNWSAQIFTEPTDFS